MSSNKRKSLSDLTNAPHDLIPTSTLRKLVYDPKGSYSARCPKSGPEPSSKRVTRVGSANANSVVVDQNPNDFAENKQSKNAEPGQRKQKPDTSNKENESSDVVAAKNRCDKGKAIVEAPATRAKINSKAILDPFKVDVTTVQEGLFADLGINRASSSKKPVRTKNDGDAAVISCPAKACTKNKKSEKKENESSDLIAAKKRDDRGKAILESSDSPPEKVEGKQRETRDPRKLIWGPLNVKVSSIQERLSSDLAINRVPSSKKLVMRKNDVVMYNCPVKARTRNKKSKKEASSVVKSWTEPRPTRRKEDYAYCSDELPRDFVDQQRAYFKEVDEFELLSEEVSEDELQ